jgi:hypothetical protein
LCCTPIADVFDFNVDAVTLQAQRVNARENVAGAAAGAAASNAAIHPFTRLLMESFSGDAATPNAATLLLGTLGATTPNGSPLVSDTARQNPAAAMLMEGVLAPTLAPLLRGLGGSQATQPGAAPTDALNARIVKLEAQLKKQQEAIDKLSRP